MSNWYRICCPVDFSETSRAALKEAADLARRCGSELTVMHVYEPPPPGTGMVVSPPGMFEQAAAELEHNLASWRAEAEDISGGTVIARMLSGPVAREIVRFAREGRFDLVVLGTHGRTGVRHLVLGSVAERVVREADCPVLVVRPPRS